MKRTVALAGLAPLLSLILWPSPTTAAEKDNQNNEGPPTVETTSFGTLPDGRTVSLHKLTNSQGISVAICNYGGIVTEVNLPDRQGNVENVVLGFDSLEGYRKSDPYFGALIGRYANRIADGKFTLDGKTYTLATNNGPNHLHGGKVGFNDRLWESETSTTDDGASVRLTYVSPDGEEGYPGTLSSAVTYTLNNDNELVIHYVATTTEATPVNLTNHTYWNLSGAGEGTVLDHRATLFCDKYLPVDETYIPTGELAPVAGTPMDFLQPHTIGERIKQVGKDPIGYDHCYVVNGEPGVLRRAAKVVDPESGRVLFVKTTEPGIQFYTGNFLDGAKVNGGYPQYAAFCIESEKYPNTPNEPSFPSATLRPGETYRQTTVFAFSVNDSKKP